MTMVSMEPVETNNAPAKNRDRAILGMALSVLLIALYGMFVDETFFGLFGHAQGTSDQPIVGQITNIENDTRHKEGSSFEWSRARVDQKVHLGDSVFTGLNSHSHVQLGDGGQIDLGPNSLVTFTQQDGVNVPDLQFGKYHLAVNGSMKVRVDGKVSELKGTGAEIELTIVKDKPPQIKVLRGQASLQSHASQKPQTIQSGVVAEIDATGLVAPLPALDPAPAPQKEPLAMGPEQVSYVESLYDLYEMRGEELVRREFSQPALVLPTEVAWKANSHDSRILLQVAPNEFFSGDLSQYEIGAAGLPVLMKPFRGANFWRTSVDGITWSDARQFEVNAQALATEAPVITIPHDEALLSGDSITLEGTLKADLTLTHFVLESSKNSEFRAGETRAEWLSTRNLSWFFTDPGEIFFRVRGANEKMELTGFSKTAKMTVRRPVVRAPEPQPELKPPQPDPEPEVPPMLAKREPTAESSTHVNAPTAATSVLPVSQVVPNYRNLNFRSSKFELEGAGYTMVSQEAEASGVIRPLALMAGFRALHWFGNNGVGGSIHTRLASLTKASDAPAPVQAEVRYAHRWEIPWNLFSKWQATEIAAILGYESYRNPTKGLFSPGYDLVKTGFSLALPWGENWDTGGEVLYGLGKEKSRKYEISGNLHYYLLKDLSMGVGYRAHLFQAGSDGVTPLGLPYREGYGEGYSTLRWHY